MPGMQTRNGKAFEYAMLQALYAICAEQQVVIREASSSLTTAHECFQNLAQVEKTKMFEAASCAARMFIRMEPQLLNPLNNHPLILKIQEDRCGQTGDVRDIISLRTNNEWEIGISCKHNHYAVKHSRISPTIDFGEEWLGHGCSKAYFAEIAPVFEELRRLRSSNTRWRDVRNKPDRIYIPILNAFIAELARLAGLHTDVPSNFIEYLIGRNDFYKVISNEHERSTTIQAFNFNGTLNRSAGVINPQIRVQNLSLPSRFYNIALNPNSNTTLTIDCDHSWSISMRIHSAATYVEESLKFDVKLLGVPTNLFSHNEPWR